MAKTFKGVFSGLFDQSVHLRDSRYAADNFGLNKAYLGHGTPRHKFQFFVVFNFNLNIDVQNHVKTFFPDRSDLSFVTAMVKSITMPSMNIETETLSQYNKKKISQTRIDYQPVSMTLHDTVDGKPLRLWEAYYEYYFRDGVAPERLEDERTRNTDEFKTEWKAEFYDNAGYNIQRVGNEKNLFESIDVYQVHGGRFTRVELVRPRITSFSQDTLDYSATGDLVELKFDLAYEGVLYANVNELLNAEELERYSRGDFWEMASLITIRTQVPGRNIRVQARFPDVITGPGQPGPPAGEEEGEPSFVQRVGGKILGDAAGRAVSRIEGTLGGIVGSIPNAIGSAISTTIFGGTVSFQPDPIKAIKTSVNEAGRDIFNTSRRNVGSAIAGGVRDAFGRAVNPPEGDAGSGGGIGGGTGG